MLQKWSMYAVAKVFFDEPTKEHYLIEISRKAKVAHTSVAVQLSELKKQGLIHETVEKKGSRRFPLYSANVESVEYRKYKKLANLYALQASGLLQALSDRFMPRALVLFGSYARGEDSETGDIDLFLQCKKSDFDCSLFEKKL